MGHVVILEPSHVHLALLNFHYFLCYSIDVTNMTIMRSFADSEENQMDEDREYREEYGDDYTKGATSHPTS